MTASTIPPTTLGGRLAPEVGSGRFRIERPGSRVDRLLASAVGLPRAGADVSVTLRVHGAGTEDRWVRTFGGRRLTSHQHLDGGTILERVGPVELRLQASNGPDGGLRLTSVGAALVIGRRRWALAERWCLKVTCDVEPAGLDRRRLWVQVDAPCGRPLCRYGGILVDLPWGGPAMGAEQ